MRRVCTDEYSQNIKQREIISYILENGEDFDLKKLAEHMEMTYFQLRKEMNSLLENGRLVVKDGVIVASAECEKIFLRKETDSLEKYQKDDTMEEGQVYLPRDFQNKFSGYN